MAAAGSAYEVSGERVISPVLKVLAGPNAGSILQLHFPTTSFGRSGRVTYSFPNIRDLSRLHFTIIAEDGKLLIEDNDSTNGTFVNGNMVESLQLHLGDVVEAGPIQMEVVAAAS